MIIYEIGACPEETTGENVTQGIFHWNITAGDHFTFTRCPYGENTLFSLNYSASRYCQCNDNTCQRPFWLESDTSQCNYQSYNDSRTSDALSILLQVQVELVLHLYFN